MKSTVVSITSASPTPFVPVSPGGSGSAVFPMSVAVLNLGSADIYIGGADVTSANGFPLVVGADPFYYDFVGAGDAMYGICAAATGPCAVRVLRRDI